MMRSNSQLLSRALVVVLAIVCSRAALSEDWTRFRGPNGTGISETSLPATWTEKDYLFNVSLPGIGHSSPVIYQNKLFVQSADPKTATQIVLSLDATNGSIRWQKEFPLATYVIHLRNSFASSTPAVDEEHVYFAWASPEESTLTAFDHDGNVVWQQTFGPYVSQHGFGSSPILYQDLVILCLQHEKPKQNGPRTETSSIVAVDRQTGEIRWQTKRMTENTSYSVPCILSRTDRPDELICCSTVDGIFSLDPLTGRPNWSREVFTMRTVSSPIIASGLVFGSTGSGAGGNYVVALRPGPEPEVAYEVRRQAPYVPTMIAYQDLVFLWFDKGIVTCLDAASGRQHWQERVGGDFSGSPVIAGGRLYCISEEGDVVVLAAEPNFELLGRNPLGEESRSTPAVANGRMYLRTYSRLMCIGGRGAT
jgi:outer membrane protein assembly factor BamB